MSRTRPPRTPPVTTVALARAYRERIVAALPAGSRFEPLMTLYLTDNTTPAEIEKARASGLVKAVKLYPAGATTNSDSGVTDIGKVQAVLEKMAEVGLPLLLHGEVTHADLSAPTHHQRFQPGPFRARHAVRIVLAGLVAVDFAQARSTLEYPLRGRCGKQVLQKKRTVAVLFDEPSAEAGFRLRKGQRLAKEFDVFVVVLRSKAHN